MGYIDELIANCYLAKNAKPLKEFVMKDIGELDFIKSAIYIIELDAGDAHKAFDDFSNYRALKERKCARLNNISNVFYVGSSTTNLKKRIREHIGYGYKNTYALNLEHWFQGKYKITVKEYDVSRNVLQIIEDDIANTLKPAFGKMGSNSK